MYTNAVCAVYLSSMEGFGLPVIEAMKYDCPIVTTRKTSLPEIGGIAACYVDRDNTEDLIEMLLKLEHEDSFREQCVERGKENLKRFDWEDSAKKICRY